MSVLNLSIDASQIPAQDQKQQKVRIAVQQGGRTRSQVVTIANGKAATKFDVDPKQTGVRIDLRDLNRVQAGAATRDQNIQFGLPFS